MREFILTVILLLLGALTTTLAESYIPDNAKTFRNQLGHLTGVTNTNTNTESSSKSPLPLRDNITVVFIGDSTMRNQLLYMCDMMGSWRSIKKKIFQNHSDYHDIAKKWEFIDQKRLVNSAFYCDGKGWGRLV